jgi:hypothetical protein
MVPRHQLVPAFHARTADRAFQADNAGHALRTDATTNADTVAGLSPAEIVPIGLIAPFFGSPGNLPAGWRVCDGSVVNDSESSLNGQTLPNLSQRFVRGLATGESVGAVGGQDVHDLTVPQHQHDYTVSVQPHTHAVGPQPEHQHETSIGTINQGAEIKLVDAPFGEGTSSGVGFVTSFFGGAYFQDYSFTPDLTSPAGAHAHDLDEAGGAEISGSTAMAASVTLPVQNVPSYVALYWIIRIK